MAVLTLYLIYERVLRTYTDTLYCNDGNNSNAATFNNNWTEPQRTVSATIMDVFNLKLILSASRSAAAIELGLISVKRRELVNGQGTRTPE